MDLKRGIDKAVDKVVESIKAQSETVGDNYDKIEQVAGLNICIVTSANTDNEAKALLEKFGMPFRK